MASIPTRLSREWEPRYVRMVAVSAVAHAVVLGVILFVGALRPPAPQPPPAYSVVLTDGPSAVGAAPAGASGRDLQGGATGAARPRETRVEGGGGEAGPKIARLGTPAPVVEPPPRREPAAVDPKPMPQSPDPTPKGSATPAANPPVTPESIVGVPEKAPAKPAPPAKPDVPLVPREVAPEKAAPPKPEARAPKRETPPPTAAAQKPEAPKPNTAKPPAPTGALAKRDPKPVTTDAKPPATEPKPPATEPKPREAPPAVKAPSPPATTPPRAQTPDARSERAASASDGKRAAETTPAKPGSPADASKPAPDAKAAAGTDAPAAPTAGNAAKPSGGDAKAKAGDEAQRASGDAKPAGAPDGTAAGGTAAKSSPGKPGATGGGEKAGTAFKDGDAGDAYAALAEKHRSGHRSGHGGGLGGTGDARGAVGNGGDEAFGNGGQPIGIEFAAYRSQVTGAVRRRWVHEPRPGLVAVVGFNIGPDGSVSSVRLQRSSGNAEYDRSALQAVQRVHLSPPPPRYADQFRDFTIRFYSEGRVGGG